MEDIEEKVVLWDLCYYVWTKRLCKYSSGDTLWFRFLTRTCSLQLLHNSPYGLRHVPAVAVSVFVSAKSSLLSLRSCILQLPLWLFSWFHILHRRPIFRKINWVNFFKSSTSPSSIQNVTFFLLKCTPPYMDGASSIEKLLQPQDFWLDDFLNQLSTFSM